MQKVNVESTIEHKSQTPKSLTASKKVIQSFKCLFARHIFLGFQNIWKFAFLFFSSASAVLINKMYMYQTYPEFDAFRKGDIMKLFIYGLPFAGIFTVFDMLMHYLFDDLCQKYYISHQSYQDPITRSKRCYTLVKWGYSIFYYALSSLAAYLLLVNTSYFPSWLGGTGSPKNIYNDFPQNSQFSFQIEVFYILQFGKHFSRFFGHVFIRPEGNFYEYVLHHALSMFLIFFSYTMDQWLIGTFVLLVHDLTDVLLIVIRGYKDFKYRSNTVLYIFYAISISNWVLWRVLIFFYALIYSLWPAIISVLKPKLETYQNPIVKETLFLPCAFMGFMLLALWFMQLFWTYYILNAITTVIISKDLKIVNDTQSKTHDLTNKKIGDNSE